MPLIILAGKEYGSGSSRDWAAKGPLLLGVRAVIAESFERIHRSNLVGMGILPLQFLAGQTAESLGLNGEESYEIIGLDDGARQLYSGQDGGSESYGRRWFGQDVQRHAAHRHPAGSALLRARRHPAVRHPSAT